MKEDLDAMMVLLAEVRDEVIAAATACQQAEKQETRLALPGAMREEVNRLYAGMGFQGPGERKEVSSALLVTARRRRACDGKNAVVEQGDQALAVRSRNAHGGAPREVGHC